MPCFPFRLADRIKVDGSTDLEVVRQLDVAMQAADGHAPATVPRAQDAVLDDLRGWQTERGLVPDGEARPGGPTEASLNAATYSRRNALARLHRRPVDHVIPMGAGVGAGQPNRPADVASATDALRLVNGPPPAIPGDRLSLPAPAPRPDEPPALVADIRRFQRDFGLAEDGIMLPGGETRRTLAPLVEAKVAAEIGDNPANPRPFSPTPRPAVVRQVPGQPTARAVPVTAAIGTNDDDSAYRLASAHAVRMAEAEAEQVGNATPDSRTHPGTRRRHQERRRPPTARERLQGRVNDGRLIGLDEAASRLEHFLDGHGTPMIGDARTEREKPFVKEAEKRIRGHFEDQLLMDRPDKPDLNYKPHLMKLKEGETLSWPTARYRNEKNVLDWPASWDRRLLTTPEFRHMVEIYDFNKTSSGTGNHLLHGRIDEAIASGDSATVVALIRPLTFTREGDTIHVSGAALGTRIDRYDFEKGKPSADLPLQAQSVGDGHPYTHVVTWPLQVGGRIRIVDGVLQRPELEFTDPPEGDLR